MGSYAGGGLADYKIILQQMIVVVANSIWLVLQLAVLVPRLALQAAGILGCWLWEHLQNMTL